ncbi:CDP-glucose 4,6-dehydratase [Myxococcota bacterium]|nr:CDP-glucose 4,6-dehydratase [Myxococcota bacterium]MBU1381418.1 CDP-glucose 4,6-dehydratase [Myxococcota bacterium]MBU1498895.1 CDP-glucose 4,6-dehydratase [Myxococcota bacterium]
MEIVVMALFSDIYKGRRVLITGHTGFKGSWLAMWLKELGAEVTGIALSPESIPNHWDLLSLECNDYRSDIRDYDAILKIFKDTNPEIVFHLAAQALVRRSYSNPIDTWSSNVMGSVNILEACRNTPSVRAAVIITSDKCYENKEWHWGYRETDALGGYDPYSASKGSVELVVASYRRSFFSDDNSPMVASARAGNVIGGGDWAQDRLIPDLLRSITIGKPLAIRSPLATRPWQHVLESLGGYLLLGMNLLKSHREFADAWNFGPDAGSNCSVSEVLTRFKEHWDSFNWQISDKPLLHEANLLYLDSSKAKSTLKWRPVWDLEKTLEATANWYREYLENKKIISHSQLLSYICDAQNINSVWCKE